jgi:hemerythrin-like domain-containing protein
VSVARRTAIARHLAWMMDFLHHHHEAEDSGLYPLLLDHDPDAAALLEEMDAEHQAIHPATDALVERARAFEAGTTTAAEVVAAVEDLERSLLPHLEHEEQILMPRVSAALTHKEWTEWETADNVAHKSKKQLADEAHWLLDNIDPAGRDIVEHVVPPVPRFILIRLLGGAYRRKRSALWDGTAAADVPSLSLAVLGARA